VIRLSTLSMLSKSVLALALVGIALTPATAEAKKPKVEPVVVVAPPPPPPVDPEAWRATAPTPSAESAWQAPVAKTFTLANGIPVYLVERPGLPLVSVRLVVGAGREANPASKAGLSAITANMLDEGTAKRSALQINSDATGLGATLVTGGLPDYAVVGLDALTGDTLGPSLDLMTEVALKPKFDSKEFSRIKAETLAEIQNLASDPRDRVGRVFSEQLFGKGHPYGSPVIGDAASVGALKVSDVKSFYKTWYHAGNAAIVVAGAVTEGDIKPLLEARFGAWKAGKATRTAVAAPVAPAKTRVVFVNQADAVQSALRVGTTGVSRVGADYWPANLAGTIVGGMFSSRININLREEHGWSYGAYGGFSDVRDFGTFAVRTSVQADKTAPAITEILKELKDAASKPPADADLKMARDSILKSLAGNFETNEATAGAFVQAPQFGLGADLWRTYVTDATAATSEGITAAAKTFFDPARQLIVVVGPATVTVDDGKGGTTEVKVLEEIKALGFELVEM
jgi:zinc protease